MQHNIQKLLYNLHLDELYLKFSPVLFRFGMIMIPQRKMSAADPDTGSKITEKFLQICTNTRDTVDSVNESGEIQQGKKLREDVMMRSQSAHGIHPLVLSFVDLAQGTNHVPCLSARGYVQSL
ncbi:hypothetical protein Q7C36_014811 [Tachysurus vachellii]|uniref:Uncharacterized protein n=1 Tax=Tachysurus vachellii TaxID=175792 RepID=A0AA88MDZ7_TACVA|nr:hypothetical protein Q7C36_014811 [Tachysurus vachellii]